MVKIIGIDLNRDGNSAIIMEDGSITRFSDIEPVWVLPSPIMIMKNQDKDVSVDGKKWSEEEQLALYLLNIKRYVEKRLRERVSEAVISVPSCFSFKQCLSVRIDTAKNAVGS